jgi:hypothetical protein
VAYGENTNPTKVEAWLEHRSPGYRFGWVLLFLLATYVVMAAGPPDAWVRVVTVFLQWLTLMAALLAARTGRHLFRVAAVVGLIAFLASVASVAVSNSHDPSGVFFGLNVLLVAFAPVAIATSLYRRRTVDVQTVLGAICIYVLLGMMFSFLYAAIDAIGQESFFVQTHHATIPNFLYFSFITQTTVGYGDYTAAGNLGRALASLEALIGQLYLVTVIAVLVSRMAGQSRAAAAADVPAAAASPIPGDAREAGAGPDSTE